MKSQKWTVSRFISIRWSGGVCELVSPTTSEVTEIEDSRILEVLYQFSTPKRISEIQTSLSGSELRNILNVLMESEILIKSTLKKQRDPYSRWESHDLLFHKISR